jgi:hypothetical protein
MMGSPAVLRPPCPYCAIDDGVRNTLAVARVTLLDEIVRRASPVLAWDKEKADAWLPGLWDALNALKVAEDAQPDGETTR